MKRVRFRRRSRRNLTRLRAAVGVLAAVGLLLGTFFRCRPIVTAFAESKARWLAAETANQTVEQVLTAYQDVCNTIVRIHYTDNNAIASVELNTAAINMVRTAAVHAAMEDLESFSSLSVGIPLGTLMGFECLSGWGPLVRFPISVTGTVLSNMSSALEAVGINQSTYRLLIHLKITLTVVTPGGRSSVVSEFSYPIAETVILGAVPDNLTEVYGDDESALDKIFNFGTNN